MPANDPFYEGMTPQGQAKKQLIRIWPSIYNFINYFFWNIVGGLKDMIRIAKQSITGKW